jgi:hypothetical protein
MHGCNVNLETITAHARVFVVTDEALVEVVAGADC